MASSPNKAAVEVRALLQETDAEIAALEERRDRYSEALAVLEQEPAGGTRRRRTSSARKKTTSRKKTAARKTTSKKRSASKRKSESKKTSKRRVAGRTAATATRRRKTKSATTRTRKTKTAARRGRPAGRTGRAPASLAGQPMSAHEKRLLAVLGNGKKDIAAIAQGMDLGESRVRALLRTLKLRGAISAQAGPRPAGYRGRVPLLYARA